VLAARAAKNVHQGVGDQARSADILYDHFPDIMAFAV